MLCVCTIIKLCAEKIFVKKIKSESRLANFTFSINFILFLRSHDSVRAKTWNYVCIVHVDFHDITSKCLQPILCVSDWTCVSVWLLNLYRKLKIILKEFLIDNRHTRNQSGFYHFIRFYEIGSYSSLDIQAVLIWRLWATLASIVRTLIYCQYFTKVS